MAIERFEEALKQYIQEETQKMKDVSAQSLDGSITEDTIKAAARLLEHLDQAANSIRGTLRYGMETITNILEKEGYDLPPASILRPSFGEVLAETLQSNNSTEESAETETPTVEFQPQYSFPKDLLEINDNDKENYGTIINNALLTDSGIGLGSLVLGEGQKITDVKRKMLNAGISLNRRITFPDINKPTRPKNLLFFVSDLLPHLTYDNIVSLRDNLGNIHAFDHLPSEVLFVLLKKLDLESRTYNCLARSQLINVSDILNLDEAHLGSVRNFGQGGFHDLIVTFAANKILPEVKS